MTARSEMLTRLDKFAGDMKPSGRFPGRRYPDDTLVLDREISVSGHLVVVTIKVDDLLTALGVDPLAATLPSTQTLKNGDPTGSLGLRKYIRRWEKKGFLP